MRHLIRATKPSSFMAAKQTRFRDGVLVASQGWKDVSEIRRESKVISGGSNMCDKDKLNKTKTRNKKMTKDEKALAVGADIRSRGGGLAKVLRFGCKGKILNVGDICEHNKVRAGKHAPATSKSQVYGVIREKSTKVCPPKIVENGSTKGSLPSRSEGRTAAPDVVCPPEVVVENSYINVENGSTKCSLPSRRVVENSYINVENGSTKCSLPSRRVGRTAAQNVVCPPNVPEDDMMDCDTKICPPASNISSRVYDSDEGFAQQVGNITDLSRLAPPANDDGHPVTGSKHDKRELKRSNKRRRQEQATRL